ncbi:DUF1508 domain-containing protein [Salegentibacter sp. BDJ18]|uniref:YegP family protein n=1 Tax=Salegentibacter sp. BDJ18 TaxID=2816376 RepID=UPI001AAF6E05|nr:DUF1508 domain-containing protein [Salegentibacter sp. BDJ18]MBO2546086.1 DUF1508 domain-containing protein [Salegentibacter sp. BDJ18]
MAEQIKSYPDGLEFYKGKDNLWYWRVTADNGNIIGSGSQGYHNHSECEYNAKSLGKSLTESKLLKS